MRILNYSQGADTGGVGHLLKRAFDTHSDWEYHQSAVTINYIQYPREFARANPLDYDVVHANNRIVNLPVMPTVVHYHGTGYRENPEAYLVLQRERDAVGLVSTLDLWLLAPTETMWCPAPYDLDWLAAHRTPINDGILRVGHAPTNRTIKSTDALNAAVKRLRRDLPVKLELIERRPWTECLRRKGIVDVYFDQVLLGYGNNAIESWGMGIPVIAGGAPDTLAEMRRRFRGLPFVDATEDTIYEALVILAEPEARIKWGKRGLAHVRRFHAGAKVVALLMPVYEAVYASKRVGPQLATT